MAQPFDIAELIFKSLQGELAPAERSAFDAWISAAPENKVLAEELTNKLSLENKLTAFHTIEQTKETARTILKERIAVAGTVDTNTAPVRHLWKRWVAAASILLLVGLGSYFTFFNKGNKTEQLAQNTAHDVKAPAVTKATIQLSDGRTVALDSLSNGTLATQGNMEIVKNANGEIIYQPSTNNGQLTTVQYNTLTNPRGSTAITLTLSDGSQVWLNAASSITYPTSFNGAERKVEITGEAYFEVAHNSSQPFKVKISPSEDQEGRGEVTVLGTHFNINAYGDEPDIKVTLLEGSVKYADPSAQTAQVLKPGQQGIIATNGGLSTLNGIDLDEVMAWKNGFFQFKDAGIQSIMRQISRWYDVDVVYEGVPSKIFRGGIPRTMSAANVFKVLEETGGVHFTINGKKITVRP